VIEVKNILTATTADLNVDVREILFGWRRRMRRRVIGSIAFSTREEHERNLQGWVEGCWSYGSRDYFHDGADGICFVERKIQLGKFLKRRERLVAAYVMRWLLLGFVIEALVVVSYIVWFLRGGV
jgi:hypothetical protein